METVFLVLIYSYFTRLVIYVTDGPKPESDSSPEIKKFELNVNPPPILSCTMDAYPSLTYQWRNYENEVLQEGQNITIDEKIYVSICILNTRLHLKASYSNSNNLFYLNLEFFFLG